MVDALFVYGTLMPGHRRWPVVARHAATWRRATTSGRLWDTGRGWPAARFASSTTAGGTVPGWVVEIVPQAAEELLAELDLLEGVPDGLFRRRRVALDDGTVAWTYETLLPVDALPRIAGWGDGCES